MELKIPRECTMCSRKFDWNEIMHTKLPENAAFCTTCFSKFEDNKHYDGINECWYTLEYNPGIKFYNE